MSEFTSSGTVKLKFGAKGKIKRIFLAPVKGKTIEHGPVKYALFLPEPLGMDATGPAILDAKIARLAKDDHIEILAKRIKRPLRDALTQAANHSTGVDIVVKMISDDGTIKPKLRGVVVPAKSHGK